MVAAGALDILGRVPVDVVLVDVRMPRLDGLGVVRGFAARADGGHRVPSAIVLTTFDDDDVLLDMVRAGAKGWLLKDVSLEVLANAIHSVAVGGTMIRPQLTERVLRGLAGAPRDRTAHASPLTARELEVLRLMAGGYSNREIADALGAAEGTVRNHASSILSKLSCNENGMPRVSPTLAGGHEFRPRPKRVIGDWDARLRSDTIQGLVRSRL